MCSAGTDANPAVVDAAHWRALQSLVAVARMQPAPDGRAALLQALVDWLTLAGGKLASLDPPGWEVGPAGAPGDGALEKLHYLQ